MKSLRRFYQRWLANRLPAARQVELKQRRIFIMPNRVGGAFAVALLLMLLAAINYENSLAYGLSFLLGAVFIVAILHTYRNFSGLILQAANSPAVFAGEQARFQVSLHGRKKDHQAIALGWRGQPLTLFDVPAQSTIDAQLVLPTQQRGWLRAGQLRVESRFPLGILTVWSWVDLDQQVLVYPKPVAGDLPLSCNGDDDQEQEGRRAQGSGVDDFQGLRQYQAGDSRRRLHWKAYSRGQGLQIKDFASLAGRDLWLDFAQVSGDVEARLSLLCHWVLTLETRQQPYGLRLPGQSIAPATGVAHRDACLRALALHGVRP